MRSTLPRTFASRVITTLIGKYESIFPSPKKPWHKPTDDEDAPK